MTYHGFSNKSQGATCPCGAKKSSVFFELCWKCQKRKNLKAKSISAKSEKSRIKNENALKKMTKLPAKNRKKSKIIDALMAGIPPQKPPPSPEKPKTIRYRSLDSALLSQSIKKLSSEEL